MSHSELSCGELAMASCPVENWLWQVGCDELSQTAWIDIARMDTPESLINLLKNLLNEQETKIKLNLKKQCSEYRKKNLKQECTVFLNLFNLYMSYDPSTQFWFLVTTWIGPCIFLAIFLKVVCLLPVLRGNVWVCTCC